VKLRRLNDSLQSISCFNIGLFGDWVMILRNTGPRSRKVLGEIPGVFNDAYIRQQEAQLVAPPCATQYHVETGRNANGVSLVVFVGSLSTNYGTPR
jgi:hypothetical protein